MNESSSGSKRVLKFVPAEEARRFYEFGPFRLDAAERLLYRDGENVALTPKTLELLVLLVERHGQIVEKEAVMAALWPDTFVEESNLTQHVFRLRKVLGNGSETNGYIETIPRRGYRFIAPLIPSLHRTAPRKRIGSAIAVGVTLLLVAGLTPMLLRARQPSFSAEAQEAYLKGRHFWNRRTVPDFKRAIEHFRIAVELEPRFAVAWAGLADAYNFTGQAPRARIAAQRALEIDGTLADAHAALGNISTFHDFEFEAGAAHLRRAIALKPDYASAHQWLAFNLAARGRFDEAFVAMKRARELEPTSLIMNTDVATLLYYARRYDEAIAASEKTLELDPSFAQAHNILGLAYLRKGRVSDAGAAFARTGEPGAPLTPYMMAHGAVAAGDTEKALTLIELALERRDGQITMIGVDPALDPLRADPRFRRVLQRMRLR